MAKHRSAGAGHQLDAGVGSEDELDARLDDPAEALVYPAARVHRRVHDEAILGQLDGTERLQPDAIGGLVDDDGELGLHPRPYVLELGAHGRVSSLLSQRRC